MKRSLLIGFASLLASSFAATAELPSRNTSQIECTTPDGRVVAVQPANDRNPAAPALLIAWDKLSCPLQEGDTTFVIKLSGVAFLDRFIFVNENATAAGRLQISVSNDPLSVTSPQWTDVDGTIAFKGKRLFNVSTVGVEARYVKLSFRVDKAERVASLGL